MDPSGSHTAQLDPVGVQAGHRIAQIHLGLEADSRHGSHRDPEKSLGGTSLSVPFGSLRGTQSLAGHGEQQLGQHWPGCDHPLLPPWVTNPHCRSSCGTGTSPLAWAQLLSCKQLCVSAVFMGHAVSLQMGNRSSSSATRQDTFPPKLGG